MKWDKVAPVFMVYEDGLYASTTDRRTADVTLAAMFDINGPAARAKVQAGYRPVDARERFVATMSAAVERGDTGRAVDLSWLAARCDIAKGAPEVGQ